MARQSHSRNLYNFVIETYIFFRVFQRLSMDVCSEAFGLWGYALLAAIQSWKALSLYYTGSSLSSYLPDNGCLFLLKIQHRFQLMQWPSMDGSLPSNTLTVVFRILICYFFDYAVESSFYLTVILYEFSGIKLNQIGILF